jgi:osmotically-inducible protein OsmY
LKTQPWTSVIAIDVAVRNGVVHLSGTITDDGQRRALRVAAENVPGVKKVEEYLTWVDPISGFYVEASPPKE